MKCFGRDPESGATLEVSYEESILSVEPAAGPAEFFIAPGWIDLQVNGFAGVDYNRPDTPKDELSRSREVLFSTGVTRFYPTVITGPQDDMIGALRNLAGFGDAFHVEGP